jgi:hypothetical protein
MQAGRQGGSHHELLVGADLGERDGDDAALGVLAQGLQGSRDVKTEGNDGRCFQLLAAARPSCLSASPCMSAPCAACCVPTP